MSNPIVILVHRERVKDAHQAFKDIIERLYKPDLQVRYDEIRHRIDIADSITFLFRCGDYRNLIGMRYDLYNTDSFIFEDHISTRCKNGPKGQIYDIMIFIDKIMQGYDK